MLTQEQIERFFSDGYLVIENVFDHNTILNPVKEEYRQLLDQLIAQWIQSGEISPPPADADFFDKLNIC